MGTKRALAEPVAEIIRNLPGSGHVVDMFCGVGTVTQQLAGIAPVIMNDTGLFLEPLLRARFMSSAQVMPERLIRALEENCRQQQARLCEQFEGRLRREALMINSTPAALFDYIENSPHVGNDSRVSTMAARASACNDAQRYCMMTLYFSASYISTSQAIALDAIRYAIDELDCDQHSRSHALAGLIVALDRVLNSPGHSAQYLKPNNNATYARIQYTWKRDVWTTYCDVIRNLTPDGSLTWRLMNMCRKANAIDLLNDRSLPRVRAVYADPPYTKDHYSRYYHVHESLYQYDFPESRGKGRYRTGRFASPFCLAATVQESFTQLFKSVAGKEIPLVLSYPVDGLLWQRGCNLGQILGDHFANVAEREYQIRHSTLGASKGVGSNIKSERIYVCTN